MKLFEGTKIASGETPEDADRFCFGQEGAEGSKWWTWSSFKGYIAYLTGIGVDTIYEEETDNYTMVRKISSSGSYEISLKYKVSKDNDYSVTLLEQDEALIMNVEYVDALITKGISYGQWTIDRWGLVARAGTVLTDIPQINIFGGYYVGQFVGDHLTSWFSATSYDSTRNLLIDLSTAPMTLALESTLIDDTENWRHLTIKGHYKRK